MAGGRSAKAIKAVLTLASACSLLLAGGAAPAGSITLSTPTISTPTVTVKAPTVPLPTPTVTAPTVPLPTPTVTAPTVPLPTPTVKAPTVPLPTPTVKAPTLSTPTVKAPTVTVKAPTISTPTVSTKLPAVSTTTTKITAKAPSVTVAPGGVTVRSGAAPTLTGGRLPAATGGSTIASRAPSAAAASAAGAGSPGLAGGAGALGNYGRLPTIEAPPGSRAFARIASRERALKAVVARLQGCLGELPEGQRELLELRAGTGASRPLSPRATAAALHVPIARLARLEARAVKALGRIGRTHACGRLASIVAGVASYLTAAFGGSLPPGAAAGGVEAARYEWPADLATKGQSGDRGLLGSNFSPLPGGAISLLLLLLLAGLALAALIADAAGQGPRHEQWRRRMHARLSSWR